MQRWQFSDNKIYVVVFIGVGTGGGDRGKGPPLSGLGIIPHFLL